MTDINEILTQTFSDRDTSRGARPSMTDIHARVRRRRRKRATTTASAVVVSGLGVVGVVAQRETSRPIPTSAAASPEPAPALARCDTGDYQGPETASQGTDSGTAPAAPAATDASTSVDGTIEIPEDAQTTDTTFPDSTTTTEAATAETATPAVESGEPETSVATPRLVCIDGRLSDAEAAYQRLLELNRLLPTSSDNPDGQAPGGTEVPSYGSGPTETASTDAP